MSTVFSPEAERLDKRWQDNKNSQHRRRILGIVTSLWRPEMKILDVGCGSGLFYEQLPDHVKPAHTGVDYTTEFIEMCQKKYPEGNFRQADALDLPFEDGSFDIVVNTSLLQHIPEWQRALSEICRVASKYVITTTRIHLKKTEKSPVVKIWSWRFNLADMLREQKKYGRASWWWTVGTDGNERMTAIFLLQKSLTNASPLPR